MGILEDIYNAVIDGKVEDAAAGVAKGLDSGIAVDDILKKALLSAMDLVGERFGEGDIFIPQVIWSAKSMQAGMDLLRPHFTEDQQGKSAKIIIGTAICVALIPVVLSMGRWLERSRGGAATMHEPKELVDAG